MCPRGIRLAALAVGVWLPAAVAAAEAAAPGSQKPSRRLDWFAVPLLAYNSDNGLGFGARGELAQRAPGYEPYRAAYMLQGYASLRNYHYHMLRYDRIGLFWTKRLRLTVNGVYRQWGNDGYWGLGNDATRQRRYVGDFDDDDPRGDRYRYRLLQPFLHATLRIKLVGRVAGFVSLNGKYSDVTAYDGSLLAEQRPPGIDGGFDMLASGGVLYDSRRPEADAQRGIFAELSLSGTIPNPEGPARLFSLFASVRAYRALLAWLVVAGRAMTELMFGDVPFYEMVHWHGSVPIAGFGGFEAVRGVPFGRWRARHRAVASVELRLRLVQRLIFRRPIALQLGLFSDAGIVWGSGRAEPGLPEPAFPLHVTGGAGLRLVFAEAFVGRLDAALGIDPIREPEGSVTDALSHGIYLTFGQSF